MIKSTLIRFPKTCLGEIPIVCYWIHYSNHINKKRISYLINCKPSKRLNTTGIASRVHNKSALMKARKLKVRKPHLYNNITNNRAISKFYGFFFAWTQLQSWHRCWIVSQWPNPYRPKQENGHKGCMVIVTLIIIDQRILF